MIPVFPNKSYKLSYHINPVVFSNSKQLFFFLKKDTTMMKPLYGKCTMWHLIN